MNSLTKLLLAGLVLAGAGCDGTLFAKAGAPAARPSAGPVPQISLDPRVLTLNVPSEDGNAGPYAATGSFQVKGVTFDAKAALWTTSDSAVAAVDAQGIVAARATGSAMVTVTVDGITATADVQVQDRGGQATVTLI